MSVYRHSQLRCGSRFLDSDFARRFLEALGVQRMWLQAPCEGAPSLSMERRLFLDWRISPVLGASGRSGVCFRQLDRPTGGSGGRNFSCYSSASNCNAALSSEETGVDSAHRGYRLSVLFHSFGCGYGQSVVVPGLQRPPILKTNGAGGFADSSPALHCSLGHCWFKSRRSVIEYTGLEYSAVDRVPAGRRCADSGARDFGGRESCAGMVRFAEGIVSALRTGSGG